ncbi:TB2/DP1, HVA22 family-domain-containing protein [Trametes punicea]|nr:TB2/DP1, HVA22 family-domain-containing protein [Trametes punicea]
MLMSMLSHALTAWFAFLLPSYATWKALAHRPISEPELERWAMYWAVVGAFVAIEYVSGWLLDWIPFYWEVRTVFLLFLALPQTQGSTWVYTTYLQPFLLKNQADIDASIAAAQTNVLTFVRSRLQVFWQTFWDLATRASAQQRDPTQQQQQQQQQQQAPGGTNPVELARSLWVSYGSSLLGAFQQAARPATGAQPASAAAPNAAPSRPGPAVTPYAVGSSSSVQVNPNAFSAEMANNFSPAATPETNLPPRFPEPEVPAAA